MYRGVRVHVDVLERLPDGAWGLREVKSGTHVRAVHLHDAAVQRVVLEGCGLRVPSVEIVHLDGGYVRGDGDIEWPRLFTRVDVTAKVEKLLPDVPRRIEVLQHVLASSEPPAIEPDGHCFSPYTCEFWARCTREKPADWVVSSAGTAEPLRGALRGRH